MTSRAFLDTNVLVYASDVRAGAKRTRARTLIADLASSGRAVVSTQVLQELFSVTTRKLRIAPDNARRLIEEYSRLDVVVIHPELILGAIDLHRLHRISLWDALIVKSAIVAGCTKIVTEDLQHGRTFEGVLAENPFTITSRSAETAARYKLRPSGRPARVRGSRT